MRRPTCRSAILILCLFLQGCWVGGDEQKPAEEERVQDLTPPVFSPNALTPAERATFYHLHEGSELFPVVWLINMKGSDGRPFLENLERFGLIPDPEGELFDGTKIHMPVGLAVSERPGFEALRPLGLSKMVGVNCAACHVGQLEHEGKKFRVDGAPNMFDIVGFLSSIANTAKATYTNPVKLWVYLQARLKAGSAQKEVADLSSTETFNSDKNFEDLNQGTTEEKQAFEDLQQIAGDDDIDQNDVNRIGGNPRQSEKVRLAFKSVANEIRMMKSYLTLLRNFSAVQNPETVPGYGRADAFGTARALLFPASKDNPGVPLSAPSSYPFIWDMQKTAWFHYTTNTNSVIQRNMGEALGLGASFDPKTFKSTIDFESLYMMEQLAYKTQAPKWPAEVLGPIDDAKATAGKAIYEKQCQTCHEKMATPYAADKSLTEYPILNVKTDDGEAKNWAIPVTVPGALVKSSAKTVTMEFGKAQEVALSRLFEEGMKALKQAGKKTNLDWESGRTFKPEWRVAYAKGANKQFGYPAKPLDGIWATAPYLHNGSVPTLADLLEPAAQRPATFKLGTREYDTGKLGYRNDGTFTLDTSKPGNSNAGHEYGINLSPEEKAQLLEYLKQL